MIEHETPPSAAASGTKRISLLDRLYTFTVVAAALLFLALAFWPNSKNKMSVLESVWSYQTNDDGSSFSQTEIDKIKYAIKSPDSIRSAIQTVSPSIENGDHASWHEKVAESVAVMVEPDGTGKNVNIRVRAGGNNEPFCRELLSALQEQFHERYHQPVDHSGFAAARKELENNVVQALKQVDKEQSAVETFVQERLEQARASAQSRKTTDTLEMSPPTASATAVPPETDQGPVGAAGENLAKIEAANPDYLAIQEEIARIESQALTLGSPTNDPQNNAGRSLDALRALLKETPKSIPVAESWVANPFSSEAEATSIVNPFAESNDDDDSFPTEEIELAQVSTFDAYAEEQAIRNGTEYRQLMQRLNATKQQHLAAINALNTTPVESASDSQYVELVQPPSVVNRYRSGIDSSTIWKFLIPCGLLGLVCAAFSATQQNPTTFYSEDDTQSWLNLPVVGTINTDRGPTIQYPYSAQRSWARWSRHAAELVLVLALLALIYSLATFDGFSQMLAKDPFAGFLTAVDQVKGLVKGG